MSIIFKKGLISWSKYKKRILPWEETRNPYHIWLREIILQQTRVEQGAAYYQKFLKAYPQVKDLADAPLEEVYKNWEGLGYYSRARNLRHAAQQITGDYLGIFPEDYDEILKLKGVGEYTAAAIVSFAYDLPYAVLDGNVYRVLSRYFGIDIPIDTTAGKKYFKILAQECLDISAPAIYNQAIMDFGAVICKPQQPLCNHCPFSSDCIAYNTDRIQELPVKSKKLIKQERFFNYLVMSDGKNIVIQQRTEKDIWQHLFQFPMIETSDSLMTLEDIEAASKNILYPIKESKVYKQALTHRNIVAKFFLIQVNNIELKDNWTKIKTDELDTYGFPKIIRDYLSENNNYIY